MGKKKPPLPQLATDYAPPTGSYRSTNIMMYPDGKYRWVYELNMYRNPSVLFTIFKIFGTIFLVAWLLLVVHGIIDGRDFSGICEESLPMLYICLGFFVLIVVAYLIVAAINGGKYVVVFTMDEEGIEHRQLKEQFDKNKALAKLTVLAGIAGGRPGTVGAGLLSATKTSLYSDFSMVRRVRARRSLHLIKVNELLTKNQVYVENEDFDFVFHFIVDHCPKVKGGK